ncbi:MAG: PQQ-dependent sugar dehydrogenase [Proteobacteria bacterium]|nr:PQQ-dependent sugar dehydrogenase [Pseudomonadota bacterium]
MMLLPHLKKINFIISLILLTSCGGSGGSGDNYDLPTKDVSLKVEKVLGSASYPVGLSFAPDGNLFFTELKTGLVKSFIPGSPKTSTISKLETSEIGAEGLLGIILDPDYTNNKYLYVYQAIDNPLRNRVVRIKNKFPGTSEKTVILDSIPAGGHNGGKFLFGNDGKLYVTTGDTGNPSLAQDLNSLAGKILRINSDGSIPSDNPIADSPVYALGIRNAFGITKYPDSGEIFISENGPDCNDEVNRVSPLENYGWRIGQSCNDTDNSYSKPIININPVLGVTALQVYSGAEFTELNKRLLLCDFNSGAIRRYVIDSKSFNVLEEGIIFQGGSGGINDMSISPDGKIYFSTQDGIFRLARTEK